jgi:PAS domain S-box-containing protein
MAEAVPAWRAVADHLVRAEGSFRALVEGSPDGIVVHNQGIVVYANQALATMLGWESPAQMLGQPVIQHVHPDDRPLVYERVRRLQTGATSVPYAEERLVRKDGTTLHASIGGLRIDFGGVACVVATVRDVTEQRRIQASLVEADRMVALGTLCAGIAHEINNPLTYLLLHVDGIATQLQKLRPLVSGDAAVLVERLAASISVAQDGAGRVRDIVRDLRVFARANDDEGAVIEVRPALERALAITAHELRLRATVTTDLGAAPRVFASDGRLTQVFVNLLINACHALVDCDPNKDRVEIRLWGTEAAAHVSVRDTGHGIAPEHLPRVFEPFFTTKPVGEGTGLGLSIVHGIVTAFGGTVTAESRLGQGSTFTVTLPAAR